MNEVLQAIYMVQCHKLTPYFNKTKFEREVGTSIYGELTPEGVDNIVSYFKKYFNKDAVFYDLGCGLGKMVMHLGLIYNLKKVCGIEYSKERYKGCVETQRLHCSELSHISFINDSYYNVELRDASIIYWDNTAHELDIGNKLIEKIPTGCLVIHKRDIPNYKSHLVTNENFLTTYGTKSINFFVKE